MHRYPKCGSGKISRSRAKTPWEGWRQTVTGQRLYRCHLCHWRGWNAECGWSAVEDARLVQLPSNRAKIGLARHEHRDDLNLEALDALTTLDTDERT